MGALGRVPHEFRDPVFESFADMMFEDLRLFVHVVGIEAEVLDEVPLQQAVVAHHLLGDPFALRSEADAVILAVLYQIVATQRSEHLAHRGGSHFEAIRDRLGADRLAAAEVVDRFQVVLDGGAAHDSILTKAKNPCQGAGWKRL